jgi:hypothetical protein
MSHAHGHDHNAVPPSVRRALVIALIPFILGTVAGLVALWPNRSNIEVPGERTERFAATVVAVREKSCDEFSGAQGFRCALIQARLDEGRDAGEEITFQSASGRGVRALH